MIVGRMLNATLSRLGSTCPVTKLASRKSVPSCVNPSRIMTMSLSAEKRARPSGVHRMNIANPS